MASSCYPDRPPVARGFCCRSIRARSFPTMRFACRLVVFAAMVLAASFAMGKSPLSPDEALKSFKVYPGFTIALAAAEPLVQDPIALNWGPDGRLWVVEMGDYPLGVDGKGAPGGRVKILEDT